MLVEGNKQFRARKSGTQMERQQKGQRRAAESHYVAPLQQFTLGLSAGWPIGSVRIVIRQMAACRKGKFAKLLHVRVEFFPKWEPKLSFFFAFFLSLGLNKTQSKNLHIAHCARTQTPSQSDILRESRP